MKRFLLILCLLTAAETVYAQINGPDGGKLPQQGTQGGGKGADGNFHFFSVDNAGRPLQGGVLNAAVVTPADGADLPSAAARGIYVGVAGDVKVDLTGTGTAIVFKAVPVGILNVQAKRVYSTGTTATNMVALY